VRSGGGFLLVFVGLLMLWIAITGRLDKVIAVFHAVADDKTGGAPGGSSSGNFSFTIPALPSVPAIGGR
jgi:hypothetical protein